MRRNGRDAPDPDLPVVDPEQAGSTLSGPSAPRMDDPNYFIIDALAMWVAIALAHHLEDRRLVAPPDAYGDTYGRNSALVLAIRMHQWFDRGVECSSHVSGLPRVLPYVRSIQEPDSRCEIQVFGDPAYLWVKFHDQPSGIIDRVNHASADCLVPGADDEAEWRAA
jgi:hypothetical protein